MDGNDCSWDVLFGCGLTNAWLYYRISRPKTTRYDFLVAVQEGLLKADEVAEARKKKRQNIQENANDCGKLGKIQKKGQAYTCAQIGCAVRTTDVCVRCNYSMCRGCHADGLHGSKLEAAFRARYNPGHYPRKRPLRSTNAIRRARPGGRRVTI